MSGFSIRPASNAPPVTPEQFPNFIQFRVNGVDLGGPDVTVVDFVGDGWVVTRGEGEDAGTLTIRYVP
jgi:hypothetical protein